MIFSRKKRPAMEPTQAIAAFWAWWPQARPRAEEAIDGGDFAGLQQEVEGRVAAIHPRLQWEFAKGSAARHALVVSPGGDPLLRALAARWLAAAPPADPVWEFHRARQADLGSFEHGLQIGERTFPLADLRFAVTTDGQRPELDVVCYHPAFDGLPDDARLQVTFLALDWALGEEAVELWIGGVSATAEPSPLQETPADLAQAVAGLAAKYREPNWALLSAELPGGTPLLAMVAQPLKSMRWPRFDRYVGVTLPYGGANEGGLPLDGSLDALRDFEDRLTDALGGEGTLVAHETAQGRRVLHFYVDSTTDALTLIESAAPGWPEGPATVEHTTDPAFDKVAHLRP